MLGANRVKSSNTSSNSSNCGTCEVFVHFTYTDANGVKQVFDSDIFASQQLAEAARDGIKSILKATGAQNIKACIKRQQ